LSGYAPTTPVGAAIGIGAAAATYEALGCDELLFTQGSHQLQATVTDEYLMCTALAATVRVATSTVVTTIPSPRVPVPSRGDSDDKPRPQPKPKPTIPVPPVYADPGQCEEQPTPRSDLPDEALVVRGGKDTFPERFLKGSSEHPCGIFGFSVQSASDRTLEELATWVKNNKIGVSTVGEIRAFGGEVTPTPGSTPFHATVSNLDPVRASVLFSPSRPNPVPLEARLVFRR
jgi:hypothetical protein